MRLLGRVLNSLTQPKMLDTVSPMRTETTLQRVATRLLGRPVVPWILERRPHRTWEQIVAELAEATDGVVDVSDQTLINWATDPVARTPPEGIPVTPKAAS